MTNRSSKTIAANDPKMVNSRARKIAQAPAGPIASATSIAPTKLIASTPLIAAAPLSVLEVESVTDSDIHELRIWAANCASRKAAAATKVLSGVVARFDAAEMRAKKLSELLRGDTKISVLFEALEKQPIDNALVLLALMRLERSKNASILESQYAEQRSQVARMAQRARIQKDSNGSQKGKRSVYECWQTWQSCPDPRSRYKSSAQFARDMLTKWPEALHSESTIKNWCTQWARGKNIPHESSSS